MNISKETFNPNITILAISDSKPVLPLISKALESQYNMQIANSVAEAHKVMEAHPPTLILLDSEMSGINDYNFLRYTKSVEHYKNIPVILLTEVNDHKAEEKFFLLGAADYILKPVTEIMLKLRVGLHINQILYKRSLEKEVALSKTQLVTLVEIMGGINARAEAMLDAAPFLITFWDRELRIIDCNQATPNFWGFKDKLEFINNFYKCSPEFQPNGERSEDVVKRTVKQAFDNGSAFVEWMHQSLDGEEIPCEVSLTCVDYNNDQLILCYTRDLRAEKAMQEESERAKIAIESTKAKSKFLATMSHEIRTPMNAILGISEAQLHNKNLEPEVIDALNKIYASANSLIRIINDILDFSKIESGKLEILFEEYDLPSLLCDTVQLNLLYLGSKEIEFKLNVDKDCPSDYIGDQLRIKQVLNNLLSNALKYTEKGSVELTVYTEREDTVNKNQVILVFNIKDTGPGLATEAIEKLFDEYARFGGIDKALIQGTGLGMNITQTLVKMMNGSITVESKLGAGSSFTVRIPQECTGNNVIGEEVAQNLREMKLNTTAQMRVAQVNREFMPYGSVLIVDDVDTNLYVAKSLLTPYGIKIETASSGFEAIDLILSGKTYDIIFMDHMMPKIDGIETTEKIRSIGYALPVVVLTANAVAGQREVFLESGFDDVISKPIDTRLLNHVLNRLIRNKHRDNNTEAYQKFLASPPEETEKLTSANNFKSRLEKVFLRDAKKSIKQLLKIHKHGYRESDVKNYITIVHGMKSALANIGEAKLSEVAFKLEIAGRDGDLDTVKNHVPAFIHMLEAVVTKLTPDNLSEEKLSDMAFLYEKLDIIVKACGNFDAKTARGAVKDLREGNWDPAIEEQIMEMSEHLLASDFDNVVKLIAVMKKEKEA